MRANGAVLRVTGGISNRRAAAAIHKPCGPGKVLAARKRANCGGTPISGGTLQLGTLGPVLIPRDLSGSAMCRS